MKILQLISSGGMYGAENMLLNLCRSLRDEADCELMAAVFHNRQNPHLEVAERLRIEAGVDVEIISCSGRLDARAFRTLRQLIRKNGIDVIHCHGYKADCYASVASVLSSVPLVATAHNWTGKNEIPDSYHRIDKFVLRRFSRVVAVSNGVAKVLRGSGVAEHKIQRIPNGIDTQLFESAAQATLKVRAHGGISIGYIGRLVEEKGCEQFLRAAASILPGFPSVRFLLIGQGPERSRLEQLARQLQVQNSISFLGHRNNMPAIYANLDICVLPSFEEGMPMTVLEAMAAGKPVIATPVGEVPTILEHSVNGLLVTPGSVGELSAAMVQLIRDPALRRRMGDNGRQKAQTSFSAEAMARAYFGLYLQVLKECGSGPAVSFQGA